MRKLSRKELVYGIIALVVIIVGMKLSSTGVGPAQLMHSDGYSVTGAFVSAIGGFMIGTLYIKKKR